MVGEPLPHPRDTFAGFLSGNPDEDHRNVQLLLDTIAAVNSSVALEDLLVTAVDKTLSFTQAERGILLLYNQSGELEISVARDSLGRNLPPDVPYSRSVPHKVGTEGEAVCLIDAASANDASLGQSILDLRLVSLMCVPLKLKGETIGVLYVDSRASSREFRESHLALFKALAYQLAVAIENSRLVKESLEKDRMEHSLLIARDVQRSFLPPGRLSLPGFDMYGISLPCDETGGDYFDYIRLREGTVGLAVGDVSGHGIDSALFMATARAMLRAFLAAESDLARVMGSLNNALERDMGTGRFMTLFYGELDLAERVLRYVKAGHNPPVLYRHRTEEFEELGGPGMALGFFRDYDFEVVGPVALEAGDILILYTDGIPEARNAEQGMFGMERFLDVVRAKRTRSAQEIVDSIIREVTGFTGGMGFEDDLTLIVARITDDSEIPPGGPAV